MAAETQYTANTGMVTISTANTALDGSGDMDLLITGGANGTLIKTITVKAQTNTVQGMVRIFINRHPFTYLIKEIEVSAVTKSASDPAFEVVVPMNFSLKSNDKLLVSTEKNDTFNVIAEGYNWAYYTTSVRAETTQYSVYNAANVIATANSNLNGTGSTGYILLAVGANGNNIQSIIVKSRVNTTSGMIRLFIENGAIIKLWREIPVNAITKSSTDSSFYAKLEFKDSFALKNGWNLKASTENAESFAITTEAFQISYPA